MNGVKKLSDLIKVIPEKQVIGNLDIEIKGICDHSLLARDGFIFCALRGEKTDGFEYVPPAVKNGASSILADREWHNHLDVTQIIVPDVRKTMALLASAFWDHPSQNMALYGITGTNGKTTTTYMLESIFQNIGIIGTINWRLGGERFFAQTTTPGSSQLQEILAWMRDKGVGKVAMEVSSHGLFLSRVFGCRFKAGIFTNLSSEHLDFHKTLADYGRAKEMLFEMLPEDGLAVINLDDPYAENIIKKAKCQKIFYGLQTRVDFRAESIKLGTEKTEFILHTPEGKIEISLKLLGLPNIYNSLASAALALKEGKSLEIIKQGLEKIESIPGRFERIEQGQPFKLIVDYAHTPDALQKLLKTCQALGQGRIITVFGCGGDRDKTKRPVMGSIARKMSNYVFLTSDNPRTEAPYTIISQIEEGMKIGGGADYRVILQRREAIKEALDFAKKGDMVVIAGKGHEEYQIIGTKREPFDDRKIAREILKGLGYG